MVHQNQTEWFAQREIVFNKNTERLFDAGRIFSPTSRQSRLSGRQWPSAMLQRPG